MTAACGGPTACSEGQTPSPASERPAICLCERLQTSPSRRVPHSELWQEFFHALLNVPSCSSPPILPRLRETLTAALQQNYSGSKLRTLKSRLLVQLLERRKAAAK